MRNLIIKELLQLRRNSFIPRLIIMFPIAVVCILPWVMDMEVDHVGVIIVDNDNSTLSEKLAQRLDDSERFDLKGVRSTYKEALQDIEKCKADLILEIPQDYEKDLAQGNVPSILVAANAVNGTKGSLGSSYVSSVVMQNLPVTQLSSMSFSTLYLYNNHLDYKRYMIPALLAILIMMLSGFLPALNIVGEKEAGTIEQINVTPVSKFTFIFAKLIPYWVIALLIITVCLILSWAVYGIVSSGNILLIYLIAILLAFVFSGLGLIISNYSDTMQQAIFVMWFFVTSMMLLSGLFTPISSMPSWAQTMTLFLPVRYFIDAIRTIFVRGGGFFDILPQVLALVAFAVVMDVWAIISYRKKN
ncbi:MAG: ABC transporter permease [Prevotella sp.]|nr:ABC transporter permease [Prevotella sp.]